MASRLSSVGSRTRLSSDGTRTPILPSPRTPVSPLLPASPLADSLPSIGGEERVVPGLATALVLLGQRLEEERRERVAGFRALHRDLQAQQRTLGEIGELLAGGSLEVALRSLRADVTAQREQQDLQAAALREALLTMQDQRADTSLHVQELDSMCQRLADVEARAEASLSCSEVKSIVVDEVATSLFKRELEFREIVLALDLERKARINDTKELQALIVAAAESSGSRSLDLPRAAAAALSQVFSFAPCRSGSSAHREPGCCAPWRTSWQRQTTPRVPVDSRCDGVTVLV